MKKKNPLILTNLKDKNYSAEIYSYYGKHLSAVWHLLKLISPMAKKASFRSSQTKEKCLLFL